MWSSACSRQMPFIVCVYVCARLFLYACRDTSLHPCGWQSSTLGVAPLVLSTLVLRCFLSSLEPATSFRLLAREPRALPVTVSSVLGLQTHATVPTFLFDFILFFKCGFCGSNSGPQAYTWLSPQSYYYPS